MNRTDHAVALVDETGKIQIIPKPPRAFNCARKSDKRKDYHCDACCYEMCVEQIQSLAGYQITPELKKE